MRTLYDLKEMLDEQLKQIVKKGDISPTELENAYKVVDIMKDIETIAAMKEAGGEEGYSQARGYSRNSYMAYGNYRDGGMSNNYRDGGSSNAYRDGRAGRDGDSDGRYSEEGNSYRRGRYSRDGGQSMNYRDGGMSNNGSSYRGGYSGHGKEEMIEKLEMMMEEASNSKEREAIQRCIEQLDK